MRPASLPSSSMSGSFSTRCLAKSAMTSFAPMPTGAVMRPSLVMTSFTWVVSRSKPETKRMSRLVTMPTRRPSPSMTGRPEMRYCEQRSLTSSIVASGVVVIGSEIMPDSLRLTRSTIDACSAIDRLRCTMPRPPWRAIGDRHARFGDGVHGAGDERSGHGDAASDPRRRVRLTGNDVGMAGKQQHVVIGEPDEAEGVVVVHGFS